MIRYAAPLALLLTFFSPQAQAQDPFAGGERWRHDATTRAPWVPGAIAFSAREDLVWTGSKGPSGGMMLFHSASSGLQAPRAVDPITQLGASYLDCAAGRRADALFSIVQRPNPGPYQRQTLVHGFDGSSVPSASIMTPRWTHDVGFDTNGPARMVVDREGERVLVAVWNNATGRIQLDWLDGASGTLLARRTFPALNLEALATSADGTRSAVSTGQTLLILDSAGGLLHAEPLNSAVRGLALNASGSTVAVGGAGQVALLEDQPGGWVNRLNITRSPVQIATALDLDHAGDILGVGWWESSAGRDVELEVWDTRAGRPLNSLDLPGAAGGVQNRVEVVDVSPDGLRAAFGTWGNGRDAEVFVFERGVDQVVLEVELPGSVRDLELDDSGTQVVIAYQDSHRNQFSNTGGVAFYHSADRDLVQLGPAESGMGLGIATDMNSASLAFLLYGQRSTPIQFPGVQGLLHIDRKTLGYLWQVPQSGRSQFVLPIPDDPSLIGTHVALQAAFRTPTGTVFSPHVVEPLILP
ncbi:MAG: hypothetical protein QF404_06305 [Planctomycetota bacterium]|jgi:hypothetical protein|nr:hypothetical protein [Planctomycetota bacterium]MDP6940051.1 hypothetical protein [Planctomycetota bacterium]